jgi:hypothetical protein
MRVTMRTPRELAESIAWTFNGYEDYDPESAEEFVAEVTEMIEDYTKEVIKGEKCPKKVKTQKGKKGSS